MYSLLQVVFMGCYGRRGPRVTQFGAVAHWALEHTPYQASKRTAYRRTAGVYRIHTKYIPYLH